MSINLLKWNRAVIYFKSISWKNAQWLHNHKWAFSIFQLRESIAWYLDKHTFKKIILFNELKLNEKKLAIRIFTMQLEHWN